MEPWGGKSSGVLAHLGSPSVIRAGAYRWSTLGDSTLHTTCTHAHCLQGFVIVDTMELISRKRSSVRMKTDEQLEVVELMGKTMQVGRGGPSHFLERDSALYP